DQAAAEFDYGIGARHGSADRCVRAAIRREGLRTNAMAISRIILAFALSLAAVAGPAIAQEHSHDDSPMPPKNKWSFAGPFGKYDRAQLQRGFKVYQEVCLQCHGMQLLSFRNLAEPGGPGF